MTTTDETSPAHDHDTEATRPRVPNVRPSAINGLGHVLLNPDAAAAAETPDTTTGDPYASSVGVEIPAGDLESRLAWIRDGETQGERTERADAIWAHENTTDPDADHSDLAGKLQAAVHDTKEPVPDAAATGDPAPEDDIQVSAPIEEDSAATAVDGDGAGDQTEGTETPTV